MASLSLFVTCFLWLASPGVKAETVTMRLLSRENSTYISIMFTVANFKELFLCMSMQSSSCSISVFYQMYHANATHIEPRHEGVNDSLSNFFTCVYTPSDPNVVCNRLSTAVCSHNSHHTSFRVRDPCCTNTCLGFVWNDAKEQLIYDNETIQICNGNCKQFVTKTAPMSPTTFLNKTRPGPTPNSLDKAKRASYDHGPSLIVSIVVAAIIAVDIIVLVFILCKKCRNRNSGEIKIKKTTINTDSFRTLSSDLSVEYVNTDQTRAYSGLNFSNGVASDQHLYAKMETTHKLQCNEDEHKENIYEDADLPKLAEVTNSDPYISSETASNKGDDRTYSTIGDSYVILEDLTDGNSEIKEQSTTRCSTVEQMYIDLNDESTDTYIRADIDGSIHSNDSKICDTMVYANTEPCVMAESQSAGVGQDSEYRNVIPRKITIRM